MFETIFDDQDRVKTDCDAPTHARHLAEKYLEKYKDYNPRELAYILCDVVMMEAARKILNQRQAHREPVLTWVSRQTLSVRVEDDGLYTGVWRHARSGGWRRFSGNYFSCGETAPEELQQKLNEFAEIE